MIFLSLCCILLHLPAPLSAAAVGRKPQDERSRFEKRGYVYSIPSKDCSSSTFAVSTSHGYSTTFSTIQIVGSTDNSTIGTTNSPPLGESSTTTNIGFSGTVIGSQWGWNPGYSNSPPPGSVSIPGYSPQPYGDPTGLAGSSSSSPSSASSGVPSIVTVAGSTVTLDGATVTVTLTGPQGTRVPITLDPSSLLTPTVISVGNTPISIGPVPVSSVSIPSAGTTSTGPAVGTTSSEAPSPPPSSPSQSSSPPPNAPSQSAPSSAVPFSEASSPPAASSSPPPGPSSFPPASSPLPGSSSLPPTPPSSLAAPSSEPSQQPPPSSSVAPSSEAQPSSSPASSPAPPGSPPPSLPSSSAAPPSEPSQNPPPSSSAAPPSEAQPSPPLASSSLPPGSSPLASASSSIAPSTGPSQQLSLSSSAAPLSEAQPSSSLPPGSPPPASASSSIATSSEPSQQPPPSSSVVLSSEAQPSSSPASSPPPGSSPPAPASSSIASPPSPSVATPSEAQSTPGASTPPASAPSSAEPPSTVIVGGSTVTLDGSTLTVTLTGSQGTPVPVTLDPSSLRTSTVISVGDVPVTIGPVPVQSPPTPSGGSIPAGSSVETAPSPGLPSAVTIGSSTISLSGSVVTITATDTRGSPIPITLDPSSLRSPTVVSIGDTSISIGPVPAGTVPTPSTGPTPTGQSLQTSSSGAPPAGTSSADSPSVVTVGSTTVTLSGSVVTITTTDAQGSPFPITLDPSSLRTPTVISIGSVPLSIGPVPISPGGSSRTELPGTLTLGRTTVTLPNGPAPTASGEQTPAGIPSVVTVGSSTITLGGSIVTLTTTDARGSPVPIILNPSSLRTPTVISVGDAPITIGPVPASPGSPTPTGPPLIVTIGSSTITLGGSPVTITTTDARGSPFPITLDPSAVRTLTVISIGDTPITIGPVTTTTSDPGSPPLQGVVTQSIPDDPNVLPWIVVTSDGKEITYSQDQNTALRSFTGTTTFETTLYASKEGKSASTVVPVIVGPGGFYWRPKPVTGPTWPVLPKIPFPPSFPTLPKLPCFNAFGIFKINCPPKTENNKDDNGDVEDNGLQSEPPTTSPTSSSSTSSSSSSSAVCALSLPTGGLQARADLQPSSACSFLVWPASPKAVELDAKLRLWYPALWSVGSLSDSLGVSFWQLPLTPEQIKELENDRNVRSINPANIGEGFDPATEFLRQPKTLRDIVFYGQETRRSIVDYIDGTVTDPNDNGFRGFYPYHSSGGQGIDVYVLDTGLDKTLEDFTLGENAASRARYIQVSLPEKPNNSREDDTERHGTCMASRIAGYTWGVAKKVNIVAVRIPFPVTPQSALQGLRDIIADVGTGKRAVLNMSFYFPRRRGSLPTGDFLFPSPNNPNVDNSGAFAAEMSRLLRTLVDRGMIIVTGSGNNHQPTVDGWPASFGKPSDPNYIPELLVAGGVDWKGSLYAPTNQDPDAVPNIWAPAFDDKIVAFRCAWRDPEPLSRAATIDILGPNTGYSRPTDGTSISAAITSGMAAYYLRLALDGNLPDELKRFTGIDSINTPKQMKDWIIATAWRRDGSTRPAVWNGVKLDDARAGDRCKNDRRDLRDVPCKPSSTTTTPPPTTATSDLPDVNTLLGGSLSQAPTPTTSQLTGPETVGCAIPFGLLLGLCPLGPSPPLGPGLLGLL